MARFDDWVTDPDVTLAAVRDFVSDPGNVGARFLGKYLVTTTSGSTGAMGIFLQDRNTIRTAGAVIARSLFGPGGFTPGMILRLAVRGGRSAKIVATGGHFAAAAAEMSQQRAHKRRSRTIRLLSVQSPLPELVAELNAFRPAALETYASMGALLAAEQTAGRLRIDPLVVGMLGEGLPDAEYDRIAEVFGAKVLNNYACNEYVALAFGCPDRWLHVNEDWVIAEPVDADRRPVPPGEQSHSLLLSTLFKGEQPILRYDLGDSVLRRPDACPCGNPFMAIRVRGRSASVLSFPADGRADVAIVPLAIETAVERVAGIDRFQVVQTGPAALQVRLRATDGADRQTVWESARANLTELLAGHELGHVRVELAEEEPHRTAGGKLPTVVPWRPPAKP